MEEPRGDIAYCRLMHDGEDILTEANSLWFSLGLNAIVIFHVYSFEI